MFIVALLQQPRYGGNLSAHPYTDKEDVVHIENGILPSHKRNEILPFATTWIDLEGTTLSEISQTEKDE